MVARRPRTRRERKRAERGTNRLLSERDLSRLVIAYYRDEAERQEASKLYDDRTQEVLARVDDLAQRDVESAFVLHVLICTWLGRLTPNWQTWPSRPLASLGARRTMLRAVRTLSHLGRDTIVGLFGSGQEKHFSRLTFSGSHEASIVAVANKKVDVAATNLPDMTQLVREAKIPRSSLRVIWVSKLIPNDPIVVRKDLPASLRAAVQESLITMKARSPEAFAQGGQYFAGFVAADDAKYQVVRDLNELAKRLAAPK